MFYRLLPIPDEFRVLIHPVPECHRSFKRVRGGRRSYLIYPSLDDAYAVARNLLDWQEGRGRLLYGLGHRGLAPECGAGRNWRAGSDAAVGRRISRREAGVQAA
jgi:hypothetical protein